MYSKEYRKWGRLLEQNAQLINSFVTHRSIKYQNVVIIHFTSKVQKSFPLGSFQQIENGVWEKTFDTRLAVHTRIILSSKPKAVSQNISIASIQ